MVITSLPFELRLLTVVIEIIAACWAMFILTTLKSDTTPL
jgi:hypothetical protein